MPKLTFQVIRRTIATLAQHLGSVKDVQGLLRHMRAPTTTDKYMQIIPEGVASTLNAINSELRRKKPAGKGSKAGTSQSQESPLISQAKGIRKKNKLRDLTPNDAKP